MAKVEGSSGGFGLWPRLINAGFGAFGGYDKRGGDFY